MSDPSHALLFSRDGDGKPIVLLDAAASQSAATLPELVAAHPEMAAPEGLARYCEALNYLARGDDYRVIHDPAAFAGKYRARLAAADPNAPFVDSAVGPADFGECDLSEITPPKVEGQTVVFFAEDDFLGVPYRVTGPAPLAPGGGVLYDPLDTV